MNNTAKQLVEQLGDNQKITIMADVVNGLNYEYEQLQQENKLNKYILTEFEKWLETTLIIEKAQQTDKMYIKSFQECLDKLQELKEGKK